ncbi:5'-nucleotidase C-terminal domain-containing protein [Sporosarcina jeotgali]|uniref:5'-nucleotidase C-terminal domain-containing protein n=1 Tax=Sporosarcina jeotgali TaxID=3020056 RepID=A0ABZ0KX14_9BACL|nr:5'-nucleotidase C-terminal domain-containing protein [Sporosarcina sp. B2O-1]WOV84706.1 5'-nucleotidase C-terminal domain-containing protein [Sporosarcina sp. B2O-1]
MKKKTRFMATTITAAAVATALAVPSASADSSKFTDVSDRYADAVNFLWANNVTSGISETKFDTMSQVKRADAAIFIAKVMGLEPGGVYKDSGFTDVPKNAKWAVDALAEHGIVNGKTTTKFGASEHLTRGEAAAMIVKAAKIEADSTKTKTQFTDVNKRFAPYVQALVDEKIASGKDSKTFGTSMPVTRGELALFLNRGNAKFGYFDLMVMHMNDHHAYLDNFPYISTVVNELRANNQNNLLLHGGDVFSGDLYWNKYKGQADVVMMNYLGFDAVTFGNHEFDEGGSDVGHQALRNYILGAQFPVLGANLDFKGDQKLKDLYKGGIADNAGGGEIYDGTIVEIDGQKVGMFGLTTEDTVNISSPADVEVLSYINRAKETVAALQAKGVDKIIALTHVGVDEASPEGSDQTLAKAVPDIDIIVGGHTHTALQEPITITNANGNKTLIVQAGQYGDYLGTLDVKFNPQGEIYWNHGELIKIDPKTMKADKKAAAVLAPFKAGKEELKKEPIGVNSEVELSGARDSNAEGTSSVRHNETNLGNLIADAMLTKAKTLPGMDKETVISVQNGGGIRTSIEAGDISVGSVMQVLPFGNPLAIIKSNGKEVKEALERSVGGSLIDGGKGLKEDGGFLHVGGMKFTYDSSKKSGERVLEVLVLEGDKYIPLEDDKTVYIATNSFTARGGDDYKVFEKASKEGRVSDPGFSDTQNLIEYLQSLGNKINPKVEGRIIDTSLETQQNGYKVPVEGAKN